ncbi:MAG: prepilin-type N-terminal cleavage/methylation domain-containing protein [Planctomycetota bacterium]|jgi:prepilin-type N-terminal cleavage/methylation domain-containing protein|nr:prepilin-type N-terminal cleavage/methylation domain-containing protein [Planctomycetota bacterium]
MRKGFTLIELMIVIAIIAIIAAIAIPNLLESRLSSAETAASASLRSGIFSGQEIFRSSAHNDMDWDNKGEYGHLGHLSGTRDCWGRAVAGVASANATARDSLEIISQAYESNDVAAAQSSATLSDVQGYLFASYLNCDSQANSTDDTVGGGKDQISSSENYFIAVSVPVAFGDSGRRPFFITQVGTVLTRPGSEAYDDNTDVVVDQTQAADTTYAAYTSAVEATTKLNRAYAKGNDWGPQ